MRYSDHEQRQMDIKSGEEIDRHAQRKAADPKGKERHCWHCGESMGFVEDRHWSRGDTCGKSECEREGRAQDEAERYDAHERLDRDMGWD